MEKNELIKSLNEQLAGVSELVLEKLIPLNDAQLNWKQQKNSWSILECIEHLNRYNSYYLAAVSSAIERTDKSSDQQLTSTWIGKKSIQMMHPSNTKKQTTFKKMDPAHSSISRNVLETFLRDQQKLTQLFLQIHELDVNAKKVPVEFFRLLKMTIAEGLEFIVVHEQRHMNQILRLLSKVSESKSPVLSI
jgi:uncharacterized damage-inducible protein DinB